MEGAGTSQVHSPWILLASWMSFGMMVTHLAWMAQRLVSLNSLTRYASAASWSTSSTEDLNRISCVTSIVISLTNLWNGSFRIRNPMNFWSDLLQGYHSGLVLSVYHLSSFHLSLVTLLDLLFCPVQNFDSAIRFEISNLCYSQGCSCRQKDTSGQPSNIVPGTVVHLAGAGRSF